MTEIRSKNPNLNFDVATFPQLKNSSFRATHADIYGFAVLKSSKQIQTSVEAAMLMTSQGSISSWTTINASAPVRKDLLTPKSDPNLAVFQDSAIIARSWLDPDKVVSNQSFSEMIGAIVSGREEVESARSKLSNQIRALVPRL
jgi:ABC-type glycerol-3-phosphate transport system substrate-binding protein